MEALMIFCLIAKLAKAGVTAQTRTQWGTRKPTKWTKATSCEPLVQMNGKDCPPDSAQEIWANHLAITDRFESGQGLASQGTRKRLLSLSDKLLQQSHDLYKEQSPVAGTVMNKAVRLEEELSKLTAETPLPESFHVREAAWAPSEERLDGDYDELTQSGKDAETEALKLRFKLHAVRKSTRYRVELNKAGLVGYFDWGQAWKETKAAMKEIGSEIRTKETRAREVKRELLLRDREIDSLDSPLGTKTTDGYQLPSEDDEAYQARIDEGRDWSETLPCPKVEIESGGLGLCAGAKRHRTMARCENDHQDDRANTVDDLYGALMGIE